MLTSCRPPANFLYQLLCGIFLVALYSCGDVTPPQAGVEVSEDFNSKTASVEITQPSNAVYTGAETDNLHVEGKCGAIYAADTLDVSVSVGANEYRTTCINGQFSITISLTMLAEGKHVLLASVQGLSSLDTATDSIALYRDLTAPQLQNGNTVVMPAAKTYAHNAIMIFQLNFSETVFLRDRLQTPKLQISLLHNNTAVSREARFQSATDNIMQFTYLVNENDDANQGVQLTSYIAGNAVIEDRAGNVLNGEVFANGYLPITKETSVIDNTVPVINSVHSAINSNITYFLNKNLLITVDVSKEVRVNNYSQNTFPRLKIAIGSDIVYAWLDPASAVNDFTNSLLFTYTVSKGQVDTDGITILGLESNGTVIADNAGVQLSTVLPNDLTALNNIKIDGSYASIVDISIANSLERVKQGEDIIVYVVFDRAVTIQGTPQLNMAMQSGTAIGNIHADYVATKNVIDTANNYFAYAFRYTVAVDDNADTLVVINDALTPNASSFITAGTENIADTNIDNTYFSLMIDGVAPYIVSANMETVNKNVVAGDALDLWVTFNENVDFDTTGDNAYIDGLIESAISVDNKINAVFAYNASESTANLKLFRYVVVQNLYDYDGVDFGNTMRFGVANNFLKDIAGNAFSAVNVLGNSVAQDVTLIDSQVPSFHSIDYPTANTYGPVTGYNTLTFAVTFTEPVRHVSNNNIWLPVTIDNGDGQQSVKATYSTTNQADVYHDTHAFSYVIEKERNFNDHNGVDLDAPAYNITDSQDYFVDFAGNVIMATDITYDTVHLANVHVDGLQPIITSFVVDPPAFPLRGFSEAGNSVITAKLGLSEPIIVSSQAEAYIPFRIGNNGILPIARHLMYRGVESTSTLRFTFTIDDGNLNDSDGLQIGTGSSSPAIVLGDNSHITDAAGNQLDLSFRNIDDFTQNLSVTIDNIKPIVTSIGLGGGATTYVGGEHIQLHVVFSESLYLTSKDSLQNAYIRANLVGDTTSDFMFFDATNDTLIFRAEAPEDLVGSGIEFTDENLYIHDIPNKVVYDFAQNELDSGFLTDVVDSQLDVVAFIASSKITSIAIASPDQVYKIGQTIVATTHWSKPVFVTHIGNESGIRMPFRFMTDIDTERYFSYKQQTAANEIEFTYVVGADDLSNDALLLGGTSGGSARLLLGANNSINDAESSNVASYIFPRTVFSGIATSATATPAIENVEIRLNSITNSVIANDSVFTFEEGDRVVFSVLYDNNVKIFSLDNDNLPYIAFSTDSSADVVKQAVLYNYADTATDRLHFAYTLTSGDEDSDGITVNPLIQGSIAGSDNTIAYAGDAGIHASLDMQETFYNDITIPQPEGQAIPGHDNILETIRFNSANPPSVISASFVKKQILTNGDQVIGVQVERPSDANRDYDISGFRILLRRVANDTLVDDIPDAADILGNGVTLYDLGIPAGLQTGNAHAGYFTFTIPAAQIAAIGVCTLLYVDVYTVDGSDNISTSAVRTTHRLAWSGLGEFVLSNVRPTPNAMSASGGSRLSFTAIDSFPNYVALNDVVHGCNAGNTQPIVSIRIDKEDNASAEQIFPSDTNGLAYDFVENYTPLSITDAVVPLAKYTTHFKVKDTTLLDNTEDHVWYGYSKQLPLWYDAADTGSIEEDSGVVSKWKNKGLGTHWYNDEMVHAPDVFDLVPIMPGISTHGYTNTSPSYNASKQAVFFPSSAVDRPVLGFNHNNSNIDAESSQNKRIVDSDGNTNNLGYTVFFVASLPDPGVAAGENFFADLPQHTAGLRYSAFFGLAGFNGFTLPTTRGHSVMQDGHDLAGVSPTAGVPMVYALHFTRKNRLPPQIYNNRKPYELCMYINGQPKSIIADNEKEALRPSVNVSATSTTTYSYGLDCSQALHFMDGGDDRTIKGIDKIVLGGILAEANIISGANASNMEVHDLLLYTEALSNDAVRAISQRLVSKWNVVPFSPMKDDFNASTLGTIGNRDSAFFSFPNRGTPFNLYDDGAACGTWSETAHGAETGLSFIIRKPAISLPNFSPTVNPLYLHFSVYTNNGDVTNDELFDQYEIVNVANVVINQESVHYLFEAKFDSSSGDYFHQLNGVRLNSLSSGEVVVPYKGICRRKEDKYYIAGYFTDQPIDSADFVGLDFASFESTVRESSSVNFAYKFIDGWNLRLGTAYNLLDGKVQLLGNEVTRSFLFSTRLIRPNYRGPLMKITTDLYAKQNSEHSTYIYPDRSDPLGRLDTSAITLFAATHGVDDVYVEALYNQAHDRGFVGVRHDADFHRDELSVGSMFTTLGAVFMDGQLVTTQSLKDNALIPGIRLGHVGGTSLPSRYVLRRPIGRDINGSASTNINVEENSISVQSAFINNEDNANGDLGFFFDEGSYGESNFGMMLSAEDKLGLSLLVLDSVGDTSFSVRPRYYDFINGFNEITMVSFNKSPGTGEIEAVTSVSGGVVRPCALAVDPPDTDACSMPISNGLVIGESASQIMYYESAGYNSRSGFGPFTLGMQSKDNGNSHGRMNGPVERYSITTFFDLWITESHGTDNALDDDLIYDLADPFIALPAQP